MIGYTFAKGLLVGGLVGGVAGFIIGVQKARTSVCYIPVNTQRPAQRRLYIRQLQEAYRRQKALEYKSAGITDEYMPKLEGGN